MSGTGVRVAQVRPAGGLGAVARWVGRIPTWLWVLFGYLVLSLVFFGGPVLRDPTRVVVGSGDDPNWVIWTLAWWPHALGDGLNPLHTYALFSPEGLNLALTAATPGPGLVLAPVTVLAGPVVAYNLLALLTPALDAFAAYLLCRHVTGRVAPAVVGGYIFGFSTFVLGALVGGHMNLALSALLPVSVLLVIRRLEGSLSSRRFLVLLTASLVGQFLISTELLVLLGLFGGFALLVAALDARLRQRIASTAGLIVLAGVATAVIVSPYLYYALFEPGTPPRAFAGVYAADLANFVIPTAVTGPLHGAFASIAQDYRGNIAEQGAYLGLPLLAVVGLFSVRAWRSAGDRALVLTLALAAVLSLGTRLHVGGGVGHSPMPWDVISDLPLIRYALPARCEVVLILAMAVIVALWLARRPSVWRWLLVGAGVALLVPNRGFSRYHDTYTPPRLVTTSAYARELTTHDRVLVLPSYRGARPMRWQAQARIHFALTQGYVNTLPRAFSRWPIVDALERNRLGPDAEGRMRSFLRAKRVTAILVDARRPRPWSGLLARMHIPGRVVDGVLLYRVRPR